MPSMHHKPHHRRLGNWTALVVNYNRNGATVLDVHGKDGTTFNVSHLRCENIGGCPSKKLPEDRTEATWLQGNRYVKGWILVDGNKVGLVGSNGILLTVKES